MAKAPFNILKDVPAPDGRMQLVHKVGFTGDIMSELVETYRDSRGQTAKLSKHLQGESAAKTAFNIWTFIRKQLKYIVDPDTKQYLKTPARTLHDGFADCKGYSILAASILSDLGIPAAFRFVNYKPGPPTHVYVVAYDDLGCEITLDACWPEFGRTQSFIKNRDIMTEISRLSGMPLSPGEMELYLLFLETLKEGVQLESKAWQRAGANTDGFDGPITVLAEMAANLENPEAIRLMARQYQQGLYDVVGTANKMRYKGSMRQLSRNLATYRKQQRANMRIGATDLPSDAASTTPTSGKSGFGKTISDIGKAIGSGVGLFGKLLNGIQQKFAQWMLSKSLPESAPFFLYLFIPQGVSMTATVRRKRDKAIRVKKEILQRTGLKDDAFLAVVKTAILKQFGKTADRVIRDMMPIQKTVQPIIEHPVGWEPGKKQNPAIGVIPVAAITAIVSIFGEIGKVFGGSTKAKEDFSQADLPDAADWQTSSTTPLPTNPQSPSYTPGGGGSASSTHKILIAAGAGYLASGTGRKKNYTTGAIVALGTYFALGQ